MMFGLQNVLKCFNEALYNKLPQHYSVRWKVRTSPRWKTPRFWYRAPPEKGVTYVKPYPLEPAEAEHPYRLDRWTDWRMKKDWLRRQCAIKHGRERMMLDTLHKNNILPPELKELAEREVQETLPRDSDAEYRAVRRCAISSRPRATVEPWRVGRMIFRNLADYNKLSGVQRAIW